MGRPTRSCTKKDSGIDNGGKKQGQDQKPKRKTVTKCKASAEESTIPPAKKAKKKQNDVQEIVQTEDIKKSQTKSPAKSKTMITKKKQETKMSVRPKLPKLSIKNEDIFKTNEEGDITYKDDDKIEVKREVDDKIKVKKEVELNGKTTKHKPAGKDAKFVGAHTSIAGEIFFL